MTTTVEAIYEDGVLKLPGRLPLPEKIHVKVTIESDTAGSEDVERSAWLKLSEEALTTTWNNPDDDVFNELLKRRSDAD
jgi:predicted DNA-binding antitoxin AbrB/MazE fold protein